MGHVSSIEIVSASSVRMVNPLGLDLIAPFAPVPVILLGWVKLLVPTIFTPGLNAPTKVFVIAKQESVNAFQDTKGLLVLVRPVP